MAAREEAERVKKEAQQAIEDARLAKEEAQRAKAEAQGARADAQRAREEAEQLRRDLAAMKAAETAARPMMAGPPGINTRGYTTATTAHDHQTTFDQTAFDA